MFYRIKITPVVVVVMTAMCYWDGVQHTTKMP